MHLHTSMVFDERTFLKVDLGVVQLYLHLFLSCFQGYTESSLPQALGGKQWHLGGLDAR